MENPWIIQGQFRHIIVVQSSAATAWIMLAPGASGNGITCCGNAAVA